MKLVVGLCRLQTVALALLLIAGCASSPPYQPTVDMTGVDAERYQADLAACRLLAEDEPSGMSIGIGGLFGVGSGGVGVGTAVGGGASESEQRASIRRCLAARGYRVMA